MGGFMAQTLFEVPAEKKEKSFSCLESVTELTTKDCQLVVDPEGNTYRLREPKDRGSAISSDPRENVKLFLMPSDSESSVNLDTIWSSINNELASQQEKQADLCDTHNCCVLAQKELAKNSQSRAYEECSSLVNRINSLARQQRTVGIEPIFTTNRIYNNHYFA